MVDRELFRVLGLHPGASSDIVRSAYRTLAKKYHPDSRGGAGNALAFTRVVAAYQRIMQDRMASGSQSQRRGATMTPRASSVEASQRAYHAAAQARQRQASAARPRQAGEAARRPASTSAPRSHTGSQAPSSGPAKFVRSPIMDMFAIGRLLLMSGDPSVRASAATELGRTGKSSAYAFLRKAFSDRDQTVVLAAVKAVRNLGVRQSSGELSSLYSRSGPAVKREILGAAAGFGAANGFENIIRLAVKDQDPSLRTQALDMFPAQPLQTPAAIRDQMRWW